MRRAALFGALIWVASCATSPLVAAEQQESVAETICRLIEKAAGESRLPVAFFTRLIWRESSFRPHVTSPVGAQGIAQFMPGTANERGLADPFDPEAAIPASAAYLAALKAQFGNLGLAAAAYNAGPARVSRWLGQGGGLPFETQAYVRFITGRGVEEWRPGAGETPPDPTTVNTDCLPTVASIRRSAPPALIEGVYAPFGVQLAGNVSKARAIRSYQAIALRFASLLADRPTLILGSRIAGRGRAPFYRVRLPAQTMREASVFCDRLRRAGGNCAVLRN
ncbi:MAG TPA: lytic transglycosylase domain-containing protein [Bosea sp. (in: a-proteobacteria)]|uniref:lytic transglycosylase domain-containing protein n=1 Tax=Bosea sp. (in: a-proteobacteria) TaxID=1871050 RepID=UPI002E0D7E6F|nr:lytic transglycosylase domain-containing protein [Bosea sp. (in: a-proteobacteria)]